MNRLTSLSLLLLFICINLSLESLVLNKRGAKFKQYRFDGALWTKFVFKSKSGVVSRVMCGSMCLTEAKCIAFVFVAEDNLCHFCDVDFAGGFLAPSTDEENVFLDINRFSRRNFTIDEMILVKDLKVEDWSNRVYESNYRINALTDEECSVYCQIAGLGQCEFFMREDNACHFGTVNITSGSVDSKYQTRDIYFTKGKHLYRALHGY